jgi:hypothetical protein
MLLVAESVGTKPMNCKGVWLAGDHLVIKRMTDDRSRLNIQLLPGTGRYIAQCDTGE